MPFDRAVAPAQSQCRFHGIDTMNTLDLSPKEREELGGLLSSEVVSQTFAGARVVKGFNHLPAEQLGTNQTVPREPQAIFLSSNDADASTTVAALVGLLDLAPVQTRKNWTRVACRFTLWTADPVDFCFRTSPSVAEKTDKVEASVTAFPLSWPARAD
jgi:hypothetical protein